MLHVHTKFYGNRSTGSAEKDVSRVFTIYGRGNHLGHVTQMSRANVCYPDPWRLHKKK